MLGSQVLEVGIGLVVVFLVVSLALTAAQEAIEGVVKSRANFLEAALAELLVATDGARADSFGEAFYKHPLIAPLYRGTYNAKRRSLCFLSFKAWKPPTYIPARNFALAIIDLIAQGPVPPKGGVGATGPATPLQIPPEVQRVYDVALRSTGGQPDAVRRELEAWYDSAMDRASGWFKRHTQFKLLVLGLVAAVALNINAITIAQQLSINDALRGATVRLAQTIKTVPSGATDGSKAGEEASKIAGGLAKIGLPIGWSDYSVAALQAPFRTTAASAWIAAAIQLAAGYLLTALAASLGAPFWFDVLSKFMAVRSTMKPDEKVADEKTNPSAAGANLLQSPDAPANAAQK